MGIFDNFGFNPNQIQTFTPTFNQPRNTMTIPNPPVITPPTQQPMDLIKVHGIDGVYRQATPPNSRVAMFDDTEDIMFIKQTDANGYATVLKFSFQLEEDKPTNYVTMEEFNKFKEELLDVEHSVRTTESGTDTNTIKPNSGRNGQHKKHGSDV